MLPVVVLEKKIVLLKSLEERSGRTSLVGNMGMFGDVLVYL